MKETVIILNDDSLAIMLPDGLDANLCASIIFTAFDKLLNMDPDNAVSICLNDMGNTPSMGEAVTDFKVSFDKIKEHIKNNLTGCDD